MPTDPVQVVAEASHSHSNVGHVALHDIEACIRLIDGMSLPVDMQPWRDGLLERLRAATEEGADL